MTAKNNPFDGEAVSRAAAMRLAFALSLLLVAIPASAHGPPAVRAGESRLLADHNDDCEDPGSEDPPCNGTHDLVGLDVREERDPALGDVLVFRFMLHGGQAADRLGLALTFKANGTTQRFTLDTTDNVAFAGPGFDRVGDARPLLGSDGKPDGERFTVEASVRIGALGGAGIKLTDYRVEAFRDGSPGDFMPGGFVAGNGARTEDPPQGDQVTNFNRINGYVLRGSTMQATTSTSVANDKPKGAWALEPAVLVVALLALVRHTRRT